jgi:N-acetylglucosamine-6-phosphate deacetylase
MLPAHLEGPFLSPGRRGAHREDDLVPPDPGVLARLLAAGPVGLMTVAPELQGALGVIEHLVGAGVVASIGHTDATAAQVHAAVDAGARHVTHCWNAQRPPTARDPGPIGVALSEPRLTVGLIADLVHVSAEVVLLTMRAAAGRVAITTDSVAQRAGSPPVVDGAPRLPDGTIAGGIALPDECLRNLVAVGVSLADAVDACGGVQRRLLGLPEVRLRPGDPAEVLVLDSSLQPVRTVIGGRVFEPA